ncbi:hypothetical protein HRH25_10335 [Flavisolibacter sp. BT320]|nr:hypothetical protein [Flavisolibacter longurius]
MNRYWTQKRRAAHFILSELVKNGKYTPIAESDFKTRTELLSKTYVVRSIEQLHEASKGKFDLPILRDAADLLHRAEYIEYSMQDTKNENKSEIKTNQEGEFAFREEQYLLEIRDDEYKRSINNSNLFTPILTLLVATIALIRTFSGCDKQILEVIHTDKTTQEVQHTTK